MYIGRRPEYRLLDGLVNMCAVSWLHFSGAIVWVSLRSVYLWVKTSRAYALKHAVLLQRNLGVDLSSLLSLISRRVLSQGTRPDGLDCGCYRFVNMCFAQVC